MIAAGGEIIYSHVFMDEKSGVDLEKAIHLH